MADRKGIMLAHPAEEKRIARLGPHCIVQPKLNGVRARTIQLNPAIHEDHLQLVSSSGAKKHFLDHILQDLARLPAKQWDGELYVHGKSWEWINSRVSRTKNRHPDIKSIQFHIFDVISDLPQIDRLAMLIVADSIIDKLGLTSIKVVPTYHIPTNAWGSYLDTYMEMGYEGIILRDRNAKYQMKRSPGLLKFKPTKTDIYKIKYLIQGEGWCHDRLGAFWVVDKHGNEFGVGTGPCLTAQGRINYWQARNYLSGRYLLVKHEHLKTVNDLPKCVVAVKVLTEAELEQLEGHEDLV